MGRTPSGIDRTERPTRRSATELLDRLRRRRSDRRRRAVAARCRRRRTAWTTWRADLVARGALRRRRRADRRHPRPARQHHRRDGRRAIDVMLGCHEYPHVDFYDRGGRGDRTAAVPGGRNGCARPASSGPVPIMLHHLDDRPPGFPAAAMRDRCLAAETGGSVIDATFFHGFPYTDVPAIRAVRSWSPPTTIPSSPNAPPGSSPPNCGSNRDDFLVESTLGHRSPSNSPCEPQTSAAGRW